MWATKKTLWATKFWNEVAHGQQHYWEFLYPCWPCVLIHSLLRACPPMNSLLSPLSSREISLPRYMISQIRLVHREHRSARSIKVNYFVFRGNTRNQYISDCLNFYNSSQFIVFYSDVNMEFRAIHYQRRTFVTGGHNILNIT